MILQRGSDGFRRAQPILRVVTIISVVEQPFQQRTRTKVCCAIDTTGDLCSSTGHPQLPPQAECAEVTLISFSDWVPSMMRIRGLVFSAVVIAPLFGGCGLNVPEMQE